MKRLLFIMLIILVLPLLYQSTPTEILKLKVFDYLVPKQQPSGYFTILNIDENFIDQEGGYPLPRQRLAEINNEILSNGALGVGWVISFPHPDRLGGDKKFAESYNKVHQYWQCLRILIVIIHQPQELSYLVMM